MGTDKRVSRGGRVLRESMLGHLILSVKGSGILQVS